MSRNHEAWRASVNGIGHCVIERTDDRPWLKSYSFGIEAGTGIHWGTNSGSEWAHIDLFANGREFGKVHLMHTQLMVMCIGPQPVMLSASSAFSSATVIAMQPGISNIAFTHTSGGMTLSAATPGLVGVLFYNVPQVKW